MGVCSSSEEQLESGKITKQLQEEHNEDRKVIKLLLLGTGGSGKSTIFKQMQILYGVKGFTEYEKTTYRHVIRRNVVEGMQILLVGAAKFGFKLSSRAAEQSANYILSLDPLAADFWKPEIVQHVQTLWPDEEAVRAAYDSRSKLQLEDSAEYLFRHIERLGAADYVPTQQDILRARLRTSGIVVKNFKIHKVDFMFLDVGGQRNERRKWIHCFDNVTSIIFVAAISEYDQVLYEDEKENRMHESLNVFGNMANNDLFIKTPMILFLNKTDLFQEKVQRVPLTVCFPSYDGDNSFKDASEYIRDCFIEQVQQQKDIFPHFTCATDTQNVERVFNDVRKVILRKNLEKLGLA